MNTLDDLIAEFTEAHPEYDSDLHREFCHPEFIDYAMYSYKDSINLFWTRDYVRCKFITWLILTKGLTKEEIHEETGYPFSSIAYYFDHFTTRKKLYDIGRI